MSDDLEIIPLDRREAPPSPSPSGSAARSRRPLAAVTTVALAAAALVAFWLFSGESESSSRTGRKTDPTSSPASSEITCAPERALAGTDLGELRVSRESPEAAVADVARAFVGHPVGGYRYQQEQRGGDWVGFLGTAGTVPKARISVRHVEDRWVAVAIAACAGDYPPGLVDYPADRPVPPLSSTAGLLLAVNDPLQRRGPVATLVLQDAAGHNVWELPRIGAWYPTPLSWSPDGRRFLFQVSAGEQTDTRAVTLPDGHDVAVPGALTWIGDDAVLVTTALRLGRLDLSSGVVVPGPPLTEFVSSQAGTRGRAALVVRPSVEDPAALATTPALLVRIVDSELRMRDTPSPPGIVDCFSPTWTDDGQRLDLVCRRQDPPAGSSDTDVFQIDIRTLRWTRLPAGAVGSVEQPLRSPAQG